MSKKNELQEMLDDDEDGYDDEEEDEDQSLTPAHYKHNA